MSSRKYMRKPNTIALGEREQYRTVEELRFGRGSHDYGLSFLRFMVDILPSSRPGSEGKSFVGHTTLKGYEPSLLVD